MDVVLNESPLFSRRDFVNVCRDPESPRSLAFTYQCLFSCTPVARLFVILLAATVHVPDSATP